jgi:LPS O-antigen subunit length determinant protein (WzzB/FepE family)
MQDEFDSLRTYKNILKHWWIIVIAAFLGGLISLGISHLKPGTYQAEALFHASIDYSDIDFDNLLNESGEEFTLSQYDQDIALQVVQRMLLKTRDQAYEYAISLDPSLDFYTFVNNSQIRRYHAQWTLRFRHQDPQIAQSIVNYWADIGWATLQLAQEQGRAEEFIIMDQVSKADLPQVPIYQNRNNLILVGTLIGFLAGLLLVDFSDRYRTKSLRAV